MSTFTQSLLLCFLGLVLAILSCFAALLYNKRSENWGWSTDLKVNLQQCLQLFLVFLSIVAGLAAVFVAIWISSPVQPT